MMIFPYWTHTHTHTKCFSFLLFFSDVVFILLLATLTIITDERIVGAVRYRNIRTVKEKLRRHKKGRLSFSCKVYILISIFLKRDRMRKSVDSLHSINNVSDSDTEKGKKRKMSRKKKRRTNTNTESQQ
jgi:PII-like signaling protein